MGTEMLGTPMRKVDVYEIGTGSVLRLRRDGDGDVVAEFLFAGPIALEIDMQGDIARALCERLAPLVGLKVVVPRPDGKRARRRKR